MVFCAENWLSNFRLVFKLYNNLLRVEKIEHLNLIAVQPIRVNFDSGNQKSAQKLY